MIYFCHGVPGGPDDAQLLMSVDPEFIAPNLFQDGVFVPEDQFDALTEGAFDGAVHLVGFSIGAMAAVRIAAAFPARVGKLTLISPAAPLALGDFLPDMAGRPVFKIAMRSPFLLMGLVAAQDLIMRLAPNLLIRQLFGTADAELLTKPAFQTILRAGLRNGLCDHPTAYAQAIRD